MNKPIRIAVPSAAPGGLGSNCSDHFGHCDCFTLIDIGEDGQPMVQIVPNEHGGGCNSVVRQLGRQGVDMVMVKGIGRRPLIGFQQAGIRVLHGLGARVGDVVDAYRDGSATVLEEKNSCQGGGGHHNHGHQGHCGSGH